MISLSLSLTCLTATFSFFDIKLCKKKKRRETDKGKKIVLSKPYFGKVINEIDYDDVTVAVEAFITFGDRKCLYGLRYSLARLVNVKKNGLEAWVW